MAINAQNLITTLPDTSQPTGILAKATELLKPAAAPQLPDYGSDASKANLRTMAGPMKEATTYAPSENSLVSKQLSGLLSSDSPYLTAARSRASQLANSRGLLNSSLAGQAGELAAIESALPIAQQDATTHGTADRYNADATNQFALADNQFGRDAAMAQYKGVLDQAAQGRDLEAQRQGKLVDAASNDADLAYRRDAANADIGLRGADLDFRREAEARDAGIKDADLALRRDATESEIESRNAQMKAGLASDISKIRQQALDARYRLESDANMTAEAKAAAITAIGQQASQDIEELVRFSGIDMPEAWPDMINRTTPVTQVTAAPASGAATPSDSYYDQSSVGVG